MTVAVLQSSYPASKIKYPVAHIVYTVLAEYPLVFKLQMLAYAVTAS